MLLMFLWVYTLYNAMYCIKHITNQFCPKTFIHTCALLLVYNKWVFPRQSFRFMYVWPDQLLVTTNVSYWIKKLSTLFVYHLQIGRILWTIGKTCQTWCTMFCINENFLFGQPGPTRTESILILVKKCQLNLNPCVNCK